MKYDLIIKEEADEDVVTAFSWYEDQKEGLGEKFLLCLDEYYNIISENPRIFQAKDGTLRQAILKPFPYVIIYEVEGSGCSLCGISYQPRPEEVEKEKTVSP